MVGKCREQTVHDRHGQNHQQADDGVQTQETAAAAAAAEPRQPVHEGAGPGDGSRRRRRRHGGEEGPRGATKAPAEASASGGPAVSPLEALCQCGTRDSEAGEETTVRIHHQLPQHLAEGL